MRKSAFALLIITSLAGAGKAQNFLNGDFEQNTSVGDQINLTNASYTSQMAFSTAFGDLSGGGPGGGDMDIISSSGYCGMAQSCNWFVAMTSGGTDAISMQLSSSLVSGNTYNMTFYERTCSPWTEGGPIIIGVSNVNNNFGTLVYTSPSSNYNGGWSQWSFSFVAPLNALYITVSSGGPNSGAPWIQIDNFSFTNNCPFINLGNDTALCTGQTILLDATFSCATYLWQDGSANATFSVSQQGIYWVEVTAGGCTVRDTIAVNYGSSIAVNLGNDTLLCTGESLLLDATVTNGSYLWQDGSANATFNVSQPGTYWVQVTANSCSGRDSINVAYNSSLVVALGNDTALCVGDVLTLDATVPNGSYLWQDGSANAIFTVTQPGTYSVDVTVANCTASDYVNVTYDSLPVINLGSDTSLCLGKTLTLDATTAVATYLWQDGTTAPIFDVTQPGLYRVEVLTNCGIVSSAITISFENCNCPVEVASAFSPNNDGKNDLLKPLSNCAIQVISFKIFDRWGELVFESDNKTKGWDGSYKDEPLMIGVYAYVLEYQSSSGKLEKKSGSVTLVR